MIVKKVKNPRKSASKAVRIAKLTDYILHPENERAQEKCIYAGARGFITDDHQSHKAEMLALATDAVKSKDTINHYVMSWREGENPGPAQIEEAVTLFLDELGLSEHQAIYGVHADTDNIHLHIAVNRVHPETLKVIKPNKGFDIEAAHKAIAKIEHAQGWQREQHGRYQVSENGELDRQHAGDKPKEPGQRKKDMENRTGEKSAERIAIEEGAEIMRKAGSWSALHAQLAARGMRFEKKGSGAYVFVGDVPVKASSAGRDCSLPALQKRLGPYRPAPARQSVAPREPEPIKQGVPGWNDYIGGRNAHYAEKSVATVGQRSRQEQERNALSAQQKARRCDLTQGSWKGKGDALNALRSVIAAQQAGERSALNERHKKERDALRERYRPYPDLEQWLHEQISPELADRWRHRDIQPPSIEGDGDETPSPRDIRAYAPEIHGAHVHYLRRDYAGRQAASFVDMGKRIEIHDWRSNDSVLAALQLAAQKWGSFTITGNDEYKAMCVKLAAQHGFRITNPELQAAIQQERQRITLEGRQSIPRPRSERQGPEKSSGSEVGR